MARTINSLSMVMVCTCSTRGRAGFRFVNGWFVCGYCGLPTHAYQNAMLRTNGGQRREGEESEVGYIYFEGGPLNGRVYETETLLGTDALQLPIADYNWSSDKKTSERDPSMIAQIWRYNGTEAAASTQVQPSASTVAQAQPPAQQSVPAQRSNGNEAAASSTATAPQPAAESSRSPVEHRVPDVATGGTQTDTSNGNGHGANGNGQSNDAAAQSYTTSTNIDVNDTASLNLEERRKALTPKQSRKDVSEATGLAQSKIWGIETGKAKRLKIEDVRTYLGYIESKEAERAGV